MNVSALRNLENLINSVKLMSGSIVVCHFHTRLQHHDSYCYVKRLSSAPF